LVYLKVWDVNYGSTFNGMEQTLTLHPRAMIYAGQTQNWQARERVLQGYVQANGEPNIHICYKHRIDNAYHRDALEVALICWNFLTFGLAQINKSPYGNNWYNQISPNVHVVDISTEHYNSYSGWTTWRYAILVGTAPPRGLLQNPAYRQRLTDANDPFIDFSELPPLRWGGVARFLERLGLPGFPRFINHYPNQACERMSDWSSTMTTQEIAAADERLVQSLQEHHGSLAVILGHRPTRLSARASSGRYMMNLCGQLTGYNLPNGKAILLLWMLDPSPEWRVTWDKRTRNTIFQLLPFAINVIERILHTMGVTSQDVGISAHQLASIIEWYDSSPIGLKIKGLVETFRQEWVNARDHIEQISPNDHEALIGKLNSLEYSI
jgi:hypothetical protein